MNSKYLPVINKANLEKAKASENPDDLYDLLAQPLHEELYKQGSFEFKDTLSSGQQLLLSYDYLQTNVGQGGFIQLIQNGYISLLPDLIEKLYELRADDMAKVLDDVLKVYVLNREQLNKPTTVQEFALLYTEFTEFEEIDARFGALNLSTIKTILKYALAHLDEFLVFDSRA